MASYEITLEFETVVSVNGVRVRSETSRTTQTVTGVFEDVAKVMYEHEINCIKEYSCCVTQLCNKLGKDASSFLQLIQTSKRIG